MFLGKKYAQSLAEHSVTHKEFYDWALTCDFPIHISSYELPKDFFCIYEKQKRVMLSSAETANNKTERLYVNIGDQVKLKNKTRQN